MRFRDLPIRSKLITIVVGTSAVALLLSAALALLFEHSELRRRFVRDQQTLTRITASNTTAAVAFESPQDAREILNSLGEDPTILWAGILRPDGEVFADYQRANLKHDLGLPRTTNGESFRFERNTLVTQAAIKVGTRPLGTLLVRSDLARINEALAMEAAVFMGLAFLACLLAAGAAIFLQRSISRPISELAQVAERVTRDETHRGRATKMGDDEVGRLVDSFNRMLDRIRHREAALAESEANYRMLSEQASDGILLWTSDLQIQFANPAICEMLGYSELELRRLRISDIFELDASNEGLLSLEALDNRKSVLSEEPCRRKEGSLLATETRSKRLDDGRIQSIVRDLSERHEMEDRLHKAQRMEAIGQLAGGIAHDFNNLLTVIGGCSELVLSSDDLSHEAEEEMAQINLAADRAASMTRQLLAFSRQQVLEPRVLNLNGVIQDIERILHRLIGEDIHFETMLQPDLGNIMADPSQIEQVIMNLAVNARDAMPEGGEIHLTTDDVDLADDTGGIPAGSYVVLEFRDSGAGMDEDTLMHIFEPFYTTKQRGQGTGLGLATVYGIIRQSEGHISVDSVPGLGTSFLLHFPRVTEQLLEPASAHYTQLSGGSETILVVEDEPAVRKLIRRMLESTGYQVLDAENGDAALAIARQTDLVIDAVVSDLVMPGINGLELGERLRGIRPGLRMLFISGYAGDELGHRGLESLGEAFLSKPFSKGALTKKLRAILQRSS